MADSRGREVEPLGRARDLLLLQHRDEQHQEVEINPHELSGIQHVAETISLDSWAAMAHKALKVALAQRGIIMSRLQLYNFQLCPFAHRVRLTLAEKRLAAELIEIDLKNKPASFSKISPYGKVPLLQHGDVKIWESTIINEYLDEVFSDPPLMPSSPSDRALAHIWIKFTDERLYAATHSLIFTRDDEARRKLVAQMFDSIQFL